MTRRSWRGEDAVLDRENPRLRSARIDDAPGRIQAIGAKRGGAPVDRQHGDNQRKEKRNEGKEGRKP